jgi:serine/threonine-protein kinase RsbW
MRRAGDGANELKVSVPATADGKVQALAAVEKFGQELNWDRSIRNEIALILEEWVTNILCYSKAPASSEMKLAAKISGDDLLFEIRDNGELFNPVAAAEPDTTTPLEERRLGGYGISMIKKLVDKIEWERAGSENILRLRKSVRIAKLKS